MLEAPVYDPSIHKQHCDEYYIADAGLMLSYDPIQYEESLISYHMLLYDPVHSSTQFQCAVKITNTW